MTALERVLAEEWPDGRFGGPRPRTPDLTPRGHCAWCDQTWAINADGYLRVHRLAGDPDRAPCIGSRRLPATRLRPATHPATAARHRAELEAALRKANR
ncbi:hypothetical protein ACFXB3_07165 [Streptomyces sp. NPDC059447]|uniref:hypothetical protein n=1 Tax=Streptomyces sp. NPDC059447 TaxID=3346834 RepID=UPI0036A3743A